MRESGLLDTASRGCLLGDFGYIPQLALEGRRVRGKLQECTITCLLLKGIYTSTEQRDVE